MKGRYVSVYVHLTSGINDELLWWPFPGEVKITLFSINKHAWNDLEKVIQFHPAIEAKFGGPVVGQERSEFGWGDPSFVKQKELFKYLENDYLKFKVEVAHTNSKQNTRTYTDMANPQLFGAPALLTTHHHSKLVMNNKTKCQQCSEIE